MELERTVQIDWNEVRPCAVFELTGGRVPPFSSQPLVKLRAITRSFLCLATICPPLPAALVCREICYNEAVRLGSFRAFTNWGETWTHKDSSFG
jgi:hypothetical protein